MKFRIGPYKIRCGNSDIGIRELDISGPGLWLDIDWTDDKFPAGWCAGLRFGPGSESRGSSGRKWGLHWSWNAPFQEPNRLDLFLPSCEIKFSCFTWWKIVTDSVEDGPVNPRTGKTPKIIHQHHERSWPYLEDGLPPIRIARR